MTGNLQIGTIIGDRVSLSMARGKAEATIIGNRYNITDELVSMTEENMVASMIELASMACLVIKIIE